MTHSVLLTEHAARDLAEIHDYIAVHDTLDNARSVLARIEQTFSSLARIEQAFSSLGELPERGAYPNELIELGIREFREVYFKPYRSIYRVTGDNVVVLLIVDGRRDLKQVLERRLLNA